MANADPNQVGGPNQDAAIIDYPAHKPNDFHVPYNYKDTVEIEWFSYAANATETTMQIWYWTSNMKVNDKYKPLTKYVVPVNGTLSFNLDEVPKIDGGYYLGQWNLNFTRVDKAPVTGLTLSQPFNCSFDDSKAAVTYSPSGAVTGTAPLPSATSSSASSTSTSQSNTNASPVSSVVSSTTAAASATAPTSGVLSAAANIASPSATAAASGPSGGAIAGIVIAVLAALALGAFGAFFFLRRKRAQEQASNNSVSPPAYGQSYPPPGSSNGQFPNADAYKQQMAGYNATGAGMMAPPVAYAPPGMKSQYVAQQQEQYYQQQAAFAQQQQQAQMAMHQQQQMGGYAGQPQAGGFVSELPSSHNRGGFDGVPSQHVSSGAQSFRQELPAEKY